MLRREVMVTSHTMKIAIINYYSFEKASWEIGYQVEV